MLAMIAGLADGAYGLAGAALALKLLLLVGCAMGPGLLAARFLRGSPVEKLCAAVAAGWIVVYLVGFGLFCVNAPASAYWAASAIFLLAGCAGWRQVLVFFRHRSSRSPIFAFAIVLTWEFLHLALVRNFGGGTWAGDWYEHYDRTRYFLHLLNNHYRYVDLYLLPARPPMMNVVAAFFCRQLGLGFQTFSLTFLLMNAFAFLPCCWLLRLIAPRAGRRIAFLTILFMFNACVLQNVTYTWTKQFTAGLVVLGVCFYLRWMRGGGTMRLVAAALCLAAGILSHYSAMPMAIALGAHFCITGIRGGLKKIVSGIWAAVAAGLLLATWFVWSAIVFGPFHTVSSNTTFGWTEDKSTWAVIKVFFYNCFTVFVPHPLHSLPEGWFSTFHNLGEMRDYFFLMYQTNLTIMVGSAGGIIAIVLLAGFFGSHDARRSADRKFWGLFLPIGFFLAIAALPGPGPYGGAHLTLQAFVIMAITLLAARIPRLPAAVFYLLLLGLACDYSLGILLNFDRHSYAYYTIGNRNTSLSMVPDESLGFKQALMEYGIKEAEGYTFWGDLFADDAVLLEIASALIAASAMVVLVQLRKSSRKRLGYGSS
jgi:hypothetical protein